MKNTETKNIADSAIIYDDVEIGENVVIGKGSIIYPNVKIGTGTSIGPFSIIGEPILSYYSNNNEHSFNYTQIGEKSIIRSHNIIYEGVKIGKEFQTGHHVTIREETTIGNNSSIGTLSDLQGKLNMGNFVRIHSNVHIGQLTEIEDYVWIYPYVITTNDLYPPMGNLIGSKIRKYAQIAAGAILLPGVEVGENSLVSAGAVVTSDVPPSSLFVGVPAKNKGNLQNIRDEDGNKVYPWKKHLKEYRGYPWQNIPK